jgi:hypothetical protein
MKKYIVTLTTEKRAYLKKIVSKGTHKSQKVINALLLLSCDEGNFQKNALLMKKSAEF